MLPSKPSSKLITRFSLFCFLSTRSEAKLLLIRFRGHGGLLAGASKPKLCHEKKSQFQRSRKREMQWRKVHKGRCLPNPNPRKFWWLRDPNPNPQVPQPLASTGWVAQARMTRRIQFADGRAVFSQWSCRRSDGERKSKTLKGEDSRSSASLVGPSATFNFVGAKERAEPWCRSVTQHLF